MLTLRDIIDRYTSLAPTFGDPVPLSAFQLSPDETTQLFSALDDDYHISRFLTFSLAEGLCYSISHSQATHIRLNPSIRDLL
jgi:hypothetical protein